MPEELRIDEVDQNTVGERTWGVVAPGAYIVVTESIHSKTLRREVLTGTASVRELDGALELVRRRRRKDKLIARIEVCDQMWRDLILMRTNTPAEPGSTPRLKGIQFMMDVVEGHRSVAQEALVNLDAPDEERTGTRNQLEGFTSRLECKARRESI